MLADDMLPKVLLDDMLRCRGDEPHHEQADDGEDEVHPVFVEDVEMGMDGFHRFFVLMLMLQHTEGQSNDEEDDPQQQSDTFRTGVLEVA